MFHDIRAFSELRFTDHKHPLHYYWCTHGNGGLNGDYYESETLNPASGIVYPSFECDLTDQIQFYREASGIVDTP
eukprot:CAMPEP_0184296290 /NCGR_PEP_ID=MMETSP1049-20130417/7256_1 /TAXON_ID=77928 /ORGANISM="Proteomonas sulcata, Strain CCMP704" /LENGTH=74 /DNA_ID=CAMNT_0026605443 /DNA_START=106 /DNA_END=330 /DNA_ORIENTATION=+